jgi:hypothetical protein
MAFVGLMVDACAGFPLIASGSKSWSGYVLGILGLGALYLLSEGVAGSIGDRDRVTDPLWKRSMHLLFLLLVVAAFSGIAYLLFQS